MPSPARPMFVRLLTVCAVFGVFASQSPSQAQTGGGSDVQRPAAALYDLVALRVEFQPDSSRFSTGDGTFEGRLFDVDEVLQVDPLPHDAGFFRAHLDFLENYVERVSDGRTRVRTHLLPVVRVSGPLADYAPIGPDADSPEQIARLAALVREAWTLAEAAGVELPAGLSPATTAFALLHAGVGRDVDLLGTTLDKTPEDIPSLFFSEEALRSHLDALPAIDGLTVSNTMVIPRTESRQGVNPLTDEPFVLGLSINGLLAASFLNYLGVPDLFDTETGRSAIGPFGVMDALGIFAYNGLFPPEPSAWTKHFLGWANVYTLTDGLIDLRHSGDLELNEVARVPISESEYFLVENRHRDPEGDGIELTVYRDGEIVTEWFDNGDPTFNDQTIEGFGGGVVVNVDQYDFALPGGLDENDNELVGGALIWHIDENRLRAGLDDNTVNVGPENRAVDLEEADGAQDIGYPSASDFGPQFDLGSPFDFWFEGNPVSVLTQTGGTIRLYQNRFGPDTMPPATSNVGGPGFIEVLDFSPAAPTMRIRVREVDEGPVRPARGRELALSADFTQAGVLRVTDASSEPLFMAFGGGQLAWTEPSSTTIQTIRGLGAAVPLLDDGLVVGATSDGFVRRAENGEDVLVPYSGGVGSTDGVFGAVVANGAGFEVPAVVDGERRLVFSPGAVDTSPVPGLLARLYGTDEAGARLTGHVLPDRAALGPFQWTFQSLEAADRWPDDAPVSGNAPVEVEASLGVGGWTVAIVSIPDGRLVILTAESPDETAVHDVDLRRWGGDDCRPSSPVISDLDRDGRAEVVVSCGTAVIAVHDSGAVVRGFPFSTDGDVLTAPVVVADSDGMPSALLFGTRTGHVDAIELRPKVARAPGFPVAIGVRSAVAPAVAGGRLVTLS
ncbi:MAG: hypothetical protein HKN17_11580, partial [Rhodothermales bacterium]|nr:hypothetical protein [Rhodothermales bacterium]